MEFEPNINRTMDTRIYTGDHVEILYTDTYVVGNATYCEGQCENLTSTFRMIKLITIIVRKLRQLEVHQYLLNLLLTIFKPRLLKKNIRFIKVSNRSSAIGYNTYINNC